MDIKENKYDKQPVFYCTDCLSLKILTTDDDVDFCDKCGSIDIKSTTIDEWEKLYKEKYHTSYINK